MCMHTSSASSMAGFGGHNYVRSFLSNRMVAKLLAQIAMAEGQDCDVLSLSVDDIAEES